MDIDCDGALGTGDGSCDSSTDTQGNTTFRDTVQSYNKGIDDLNAYVHSFVVLGNQGSKDGYVEFDPQSVGIEPLSIVAVVCADKLVRLRLVILVLELADVYRFTACGVIQMVMMGRR